MISLDECRRMIFSFFSGIIFSLVIVNGCISETIKIDKMDEARKEIRGLRKDLQKLNRELRRIEGLRKDLRGLTGEIKKFRKKVERMVK